MSQQKRYTGNFSPDISELIGKRKNENQYNMDKDINIKKQFINKNVRIFYLQNQKHNDFYIFFNTEVIVKTLDAFIYSKSK